MSGEETGSSEPLQYTALTSRHEALGARMVPFAGWYMPVQYGSIIEEHRTVRTAAAAPIAVSEADHVALAPDVAVGPRGEIAVLWLDRGVPAPAPKDGHPAEHTHLSSMDLYVAVAADGSNFGPPQRVNRADGEVWGFAVSRPRIAYGPGG